MRKWRQPSGPLLLPVVPSYAGRLLPAVASATDKASSAASAASAAFPSSCSCCCRCSWWWWYWGKPGCCFSSACSGPKLPRGCRCRCCCCSGREARRVSCLQACTSNKISMRGSWNRKLLMPATAPRLAYLGPSRERSSGVPRITAHRGQAVGRWEGTAAGSGRLFEGTAQPLPSRPKLQWGVPQHTLALPPKAPRAPAAPPLAALACADPSGAQPVGSDFPQGAPQQAAKQRGAAQQHDCPHHLHTRTHIHPGRGQAVSAPARVQAVPLVHALQCDATAERRASRQAGRQASCTPRTLSTAPTAAAAATAAKPQRPQVQQQRLTRKAPTKRQMSASAPRGQRQGHFRTMVSACLLDSEPPVHAGSSTALLPAPAPACLPALTHHTHPS